MWLTFRVHQHLRCPVQTNDASTFLPGCKQVAKRSPKYFPGSSCVFVGVVFGYFCMSLSPKISQNCWKNFGTSRRLWVFWFHEFFGKLGVSCGVRSMDEYRHIPLLGSRSFKHLFLDGGWWIMSRLQICLYISGNNPIHPPLNGTKL